jgi:hypothetical protein
MYEAYITKVLWDPTWGAKGLSVGGVYLLQASVLVLFWHPLMAFILPVFLGENLLTDSSETFSALPRWLQAPLRSLSGQLLITVGLAALCGATQSVNSRSWSQSLASSLGSLAVVLGLAWAWKRGGWGRAHELRDLVPSARALRPLVALLLGGYLVLGLLLRPEALPRTILPHVTVWVIYAVLFLLLHLNLKRAGEWRLPSPSPLRRSAWAVTLAFALVFPLVSAALTWVRILAQALVLATWVAGVGSGALFLVTAVWRGLPVLVAREGGDELSGQ